uniref:UDP-glucose/GDP-mannose dehydrogenase C-terminal domain-containing protein n=1 Tax=viral metagenome TaxID=1070528 RepID=A0A6C0CRN1_9ZZZZ
METKYSTSVTFGVIGVGYVGLHLLEEFSKKNMTFGLDVSASRVAFLQDQFLECTTVCISSDFTHLKQCDVICISVPTLLREDKTINDGPMCQAIASIQQHSRQHDVLVVVESSVSIGLTRQLLTPLHEQGYMIGMSPERADPGRLFPLFHTIPKIVSGIDDISLKRIKEVYSQVFENVVPVSSLETAEMCKLYENCFRLINIAYVNEISDACDKHGIDPYEMVEASSTKPYGFMKFSPSLGVGGYCLPVNSHYLLSNCTSQILQQASQLTENRPSLKADEIIQKFPHAQTFLIIGIAFKPKQSVTVNSPGLAIARVLAKNAKQVHVLDPYVNQNEFHSITEKTIQENWIYDCVISSIKQHDINYETIQQKCQSSDIPFITFHEN